jgi:hypothetical protein
MYKMISISISAGEGKSKAKASSNANPRMLWIWYALGIVAQVVMFLMLSQGKQRLEDVVTSQTVSSGSDAEDAGSSRIVYIVMHAMLTFVVFHIGHQVGAAFMYLRFSKEIDDFDDTFQIMKRLDWHGGMMYRPCLVAIIQTMTLFPTVFQLVPYYRRDTVNECPVDFVKNLGAMDAQGLLGGLVLLLVYAGMQVSLLMLCLEHFRQFVKYNKALH